MRRGIGATLALVGCVGGDWVGEVPVAGVDETHGTLLSDAVLFSCGREELRVQLYGKGVVRLTRRLLGQPWPVERGWLLPTAPLPARFTLFGTPQLAQLEGDGVWLMVDAGCEVTRAGDERNRGVYVEEPVDLEAEPVATVRRQAVDSLVAYGLGEKLGTLSRAGQTHTFWNTDAYDPSWGGYAPDADPLYLSIPWLIGQHRLGSYGVLSLNTHRSHVDVGAADPMLWTSTWDEGLADELLVVGDDVRQVVERFSALLGRSPMPPRWALGYHQSRWGYAPDQRFLDLADRFAEERLPLTSLWFDIQHQDGFRSFTWDPALFPDPAGLLGELRARGLRSVAIVDPGLKVDPGWDVYDELVGRGLALSGASGQPVVARAWPGDSVFPDFSRPETRDWWAGRIERLAELGLDGVWLDVNEPTTFPEGGGGTTIDNHTPVAGDGVPTDMAELHNVYANLQAAATVEGLRRAHPDRRPFVLSRAGYAGIQRHAGVWTGDVPSTWWGLQGTVQLVQSVGLSGVPMVGSDVGGYSGSPSPELYARWMAVGVLSPFFRVHTTQGVPDQEPWAFGTEVRDLSRDLIALRERLRPYLYSLFDQHTRTGAPVLRPMLWEFPADAARDEQLMLGPWLLAAPVLTEGATEVTARLPEGTWAEFHSGLLHLGPRSVTQAAPLAALPLYLRHGAILPLAPVGSTEVDGLIEPLEIQLFPRFAGSEFELYDDAGDGEGPFLRLKLSLARDPVHTTLTVLQREGTWGVGRTLELRFRRAATAPSRVTLNGSALSEASDGGVGWSWDPGDRSVRVRFPDPGGTFVVEAYYAELGWDEDPNVAVPLRVRLPPGTPADAPIFVASDADGWVHHPLVREGDEAVGAVLVPRGDWFSYKYSRGDWCTVEKWPGCEEASDRYAFGASDLPKVDEVFGWRDACADACP